MKFEFCIFLQFSNLDTVCQMEISDVTCLSGDGLVEAIEHTELIFIIGMCSCSSLQWATTLSVKSEPVSCFLAGVWREGSEKKNSCAKCISWSD